MSKHVRSCHRVGGASQSALDDDVVNGKLRTYTIPAVSCMMACSTWQASDGSDAQELLQFRVHAVGMVATGPVHGILVLLDGAEYLGRVVQNGLRAAATKHHEKQEGN